MLYRSRTNENAHVGTGNPSRWPEVTVAETAVFRRRYRLRHSYSNEATHQSGRICGHGSQITTKGSSKIHANLCEDRRHFHSCFHQRLHLLGAGKKACIKTTAMTTCSSAS